MGITSAVFIGFLVAAIAPVIYRYTRTAAGPLIALAPAAIALYFATYINAVSAGQTFRVAYAWAPTLGINLSFHLDGLSLLFVLLISGIGALVLVYASGYLAHHPNLDRFYAILMVFMAAMLGMVLADNLLTLFVFWELTSLSSYLLIGFEHQDAKSRASALQALLVTGGGGLALLAGLLLLGQIGGSFELTTLLTQGAAIQADAFYLPTLLLILVGAFTKSAQVPFHFWLPNAMAAPTPVSAYLHSATMVKAGVYLLARLNPVLGGTESWVLLVTSVGAVTMLLGALFSIFQRDLKRILAYSTLSALGTLMLLIGIDSALAAKAAMLFLLAHALYKGALFLVTGIVDHETHTRNVAELGGLARLMPITTAAAGLAALSMAGVPPLLGFINKEVLYETQLAAPTAALWLISAGVFANILSVVAALLAGFHPFFAAKTTSDHHPHDPPVALWLGPVLLAGIGLVGGLFPGAVAAWLVAPAASAMYGAPVTVKLALWHGFNLVLLLSGLTLAAGAALYLGHRRLHAAAGWLDAVGRWGAEAGYLRALDGLNALARGQTQILQNGYLRYYLLVIILTTIGLVGYPLLWWRQPFGLGQWADVRFYELLIAGLILGGAIAAVVARSRLAAVAALGVVGYGVALVYILYGAPDLAMTQFAVETLTVILFVLVLYRLPRFAILTGRAERIRDMLVAGGVGVLMTTIMLLANQTLPESQLSPYFAETSLQLAQGRNVVNVILVDYRGLDTFGEIVVLAIAAVGVYALLKLRLERR